MMHLVLAINDQPLEKIPIDPDRYRDKPYLHALQRLLRIKHRAFIQALKQEPVCYLLLPSKMKKTKR